MNVYEVNDIAKLLEGNPYVGRGIVVGKSEDGKSAVAAYFIMGRSENSRNIGGSWTMRGALWAPRHREVVDRALLSCSLIFGTDMIECR